MKKININTFIRSDILKMDAYIPGTSAEKLAQEYNQEIIQLIKLNANENPYGISPAVKKSAQKVFFNYYPSSDYLNLRLALSNYTKIKKENIIVGSGSDELIDLLLRLVLEKGDKVISAAPTFGMYEVATRLNRGIIIDIPRTKDFEIDAKAIVQNCTDKKVKIIFLCNPNSPTGNLIPRKEIKKILQTGKLVIVDEAYFEFSKRSCVPILQKYENLVIIRTLSKWAGLAGIRIGYGLMSTILVNEMMKIKPPFNVNSIADAAAQATLQNLSFAKTTIQKIIKERTRIYKQLKNIPNIKVYRSFGNFIFIQIKKVDYRQLRDTFEKNKIALRYYPLIDNGIRITIGTPEQNNKIVTILKNMNNKTKYAFLDRDGTLIFEPLDTFQIDKVEKLKILNGVIKGLKALKKAGYELIMVSNQDGLGTASFPQKSFDAPQNKMLNIFEENDITFNNIFICPHLPTENCNCRKPKTGLVKNFLKENNIDKKNSFVCGDRSTDKLFAKNIGIKYLSMQTNEDFYQALLKGGVV